MDNKILPYTIGNYVQYPVTNHHGKEYEKDYISTYSHTHMCVCMYMLGRVQLFGTPWTASSSVQKNFRGKNTAVGCHFLLQGIFPIQGSYPVLLHLLHW